MARTTGKWRDRMKNNADVTRIVTYNCRKMAICCFLLLCIKVSWRHLANLKQMLRICALPALTVTININSLQKRVITGNKKPCKKQSVFKVAILRMLKFAQKNTVKSLPVTHVMVERFFSSLHYTGSSRFKRPYFTQL